jgi:hypothetical protein
VVVQTIDLELLSYHAILIPMSRTSGTTNHEFSTTTPTEYAPQRRKALRRSDYLVTNDLAVAMSRVQMTLVDLLHTTAATREKVASLVRRPQSRWSTHDRPKLSSSTRQPYASVLFRWLGGPGGSIAGDNRSRC